MVYTVSKPYGKSGWNRRGRRRTPPAVLFFLFLAVVSSFASYQAQASLQGLDMADRGSCGKKVGKSAKALACDFCRLWYHMSCAGLTDSDYDFMKS